MRNRLRKVFLCLVLTVGMVVVLLIEVLHPEYLSNFEKREGDEGQLTYGTPMTSSYFFDSYEDSKKTFRSQVERLAKILPRVEHGEIQSNDNPEVKLDYCYSPSKEHPAKLLIVTSGVHGAEAHVGSAVQLMMLDRHVEALARKGWGVLLLHGINDFGFKHFLRVTKENVDLNRNFLGSKENFAERAKLSNYHNLENLLGPKGVVAADWSSRFSFFLRVIHSLFSYGKKQLRQIILEGQYSHPEGIYFGGFTYDPVVSLIKTYLMPLLPHYEEVVAIDLHTGYGNRGELHLFPNKTSDMAVKQATEELFEGYKIDWGDSDDFYAVQGDFVTFIGNLLPKKTSYIPMVFEYGTVDNLGLLNSLRSLLLMIWENQGRRYGFASREVELSIKQEFREHYYPSDLQWRDKIIADTDRLIERVFLAR